MPIWPHFVSSAARQLIFGYDGYFMSLIDPKKFQIATMTVTLFFQVMATGALLHW